MMRAFAMGAALVAFASSPAHATHWVVDYGKSRLGFVVQWSGEPFAATFKSWKADIDFDPTDLAHARADVSIDLASETSDSPDNDDGIQGAQGFQTSHFPTARFVATAFQHTQGSQYVALGKLTIKGVTRPVALGFQLLLSSEKAHMTGRADVMRTDFGLGQGDWAKETPVAHNVAIVVDLFANKAR